MIDYTGQQIGSYRLVRRLGLGGFASVYLGQHTRIATQQAAIKLLHILDVDSKKFQQEAETTAALVHPHIIRLFDYDFHDQMPFLVIDYAPGGSLRARHSEGTQVPLPTVVQYVQEIAKALEYAHGKNVIHRDIKPDNILIGGQGELRLSDFGISVLSQTGRTTLAASYGTGGTAYYMAPEQSRGKPEKASDQYALGIMVYEWLCGKPPFSEGNAINIQYQHAFEPVPSLGKQLPMLPLAVEQAVLTALAKEPHQRFATVQVFAAALEMACQTKPPAHIFPQSSNASFQPKLPPEAQVKPQPSTERRSSARPIQGGVSHIPPVKSASKQLSLSSCGVGGVAGGVIGAKGAVAATMVGAMVGGGVIELIVGISFLIVLVRLGSEEAAKFRKEQKSELNKSIVAGVIAGAITGLIIGLKGLGLGNGMAIGLVVGVVVGVWTEFPGNSTKR